MHLSPADWDTRGKLLTRLSGFETFEVGMMKLLRTMLVFSVLSYSSTFAADSDRILAVELDSQWQEIEMAPEARRDHWSVRMFRHIDHNDLLTFACYLGGAGPRTFDDAWEFAPAGYPFWIPKSKEYSISPLNTEWVEPEKYGERNRLVFTVVHEHDSGRHKDNRMGHGFVANVQERVYYVQHTSSHPITDWVARQAFENLLGIDTSGKRKAVNK